jgi:anthranilate phosphoribosyltransferase
METKQLFERMMQYETLSKDEAGAVLERIATGELNHAQMAAFMAFFMMRPVTVEELSGFREALLELCIKTDLAAYSPIDLCGTGGDGKNTFNISTLSAFVVAAAGQPVAKHGNYGVSSKCGSSNVLEYLGYRFSNEKGQLEREIEATNITFLHAPMFHPAMKHVAPVRRELGVKTFFNMLGPLVNPAFPAKQLAGVFSLELARIYAYIFQQTDVQFMVLHGLDGYDECSLTADTKVFDRKGERLISVDDFGYEKLHESEIRGGEEVEDSAAVFMKVLKGEGDKAQNEVVAANSALALMAAGKHENPQEAAAEAEELLVSGKAYEVFKKLIETNK